MSEPNPIAKDTIRKKLKGENIPTPEIERIIFSLETVRYFDRGSQRIRFTITSRAIKDVVFAIVGASASALLAKETFIHAAEAMREIFTSKKFGSSFIESAHAGDFSNKIAENIDTTMMKIGVSIIFGVTITFFIINLFVWVFSKDSKSREDANSHIKQITTFMLGIFVGKA